jgi:hypothetical protein
LSLSPFELSRSATGVLHGPPNADDAPNPTSSIKTMSTLGALTGGRSIVIGGYFVLGSFASYVVSPTCFTSGMGKLSRRTGSGIAVPSDRAVI